MSLLASAMILAAGRGERMRPLTDSCPKPLLPVRGQPLMAWPMQALTRSGFERIVVNTAWLGEQIEAHYGDRPQLSWSREGRDFGGALETAGGIARALPLLDDIFWVTAGDVFMPDFSFSKDDYQRFTRCDKLAHLWLVPNPDHHPGGDFGLSDAGLALRDAPQRFTFSTVALYRAEFFDALPRGNPTGLKVALAPMLRDAMDRSQVSATLYTGEWTDVGTPERLDRLNQP